MKKMKIKGTEISGNIFLAPMCNVTNLPFRLLCKRYGAAVVYTEMINADAYLMDSAVTKKRCSILTEERPVGIQMFGSDAGKLAKAAQKIEHDLAPDMIDINIGCPAYDVMKNGCGASLLKDPVKLGTLVKKISSSINIPLTCKIRILPNDQDVMDVARVIQGNGAALLTVHGRTAKQGYSGKANWEVIRKIKSGLDIPVVLNGDITDGRSAKQAFEMTGCDAVMVGRAAIGNPGIFLEINSYLEGKATQTTLQSKISALLDYVQLSISLGYTDILPMKMQAQKTLKGFEGSGKLRDSISRTESIENLQELLASI
ncbi:MAG: tRNA-dihydrouridine synthase family protein [Nanoarchaeota archaeon]|nr:tRNA-dihydrouridine synthase family protein [Nanoarchaeota archaeon]